MSSYSSTRIKQHAHVYAEKGMWNIGIQLVQKNYWCNGDKLQGSVACSMPNLWRSQGNFPHTNFCMSYRVPPKTF